MLIALHKPYGFLSQFTPEPGSQWRALAELNLPKNVWPIGRLDADSEGLLLLSDEKHFTAKLLTPGREHPRTYHAQVERIPDSAALENLEKGVVIGGHRTLPCEARRLEPQPEHPPRQPTIRHRKNVPTAWIELILTEGKNRQVRRMTASVGHPTLRLIRVAVGDFQLADLPPGEWKVLSPEEMAAVLRKPKAL